MTSINNDFRCQVNGLIVKYTLFVICWKEMEKPNSNLNENKFWKKQFQN